MPAKEDTVATPSPGYLKMSEAWDLIRDLSGGTRAMRAAGEKWLPREEKELSTPYQNRLNRTILYEMFADTIQRLVGKPFSKRITVQGLVPKRLEGIKDNADRCGTPLHALARSVFENALEYGLSHIFVDFPRLDGVPTLEQEAQEDIRPVFVHIKAENLIGWRTTTTRSGRKELTQIRFKETTVEPDGDFADKTVERIRVYSKTEWQTWILTKNQDKESWILEDSGPFTLGKIPLLTFYTNRTGFLMADPPLEDLAWINLAHWQSMSDQRNILRVARTGIIFVSGLSEEEFDQQLVIGPNNYIRSQNKDARMSIVEHTGKAIGAGRDDLQDLEAKGEVLGLAPLVRNSGNKTATARVLDESKNNTDIGSWVSDLEMTIDDAYALAGEWIKAPVSDDLHVDINQDFGLSNEDIKELDQLMQLNALGKIKDMTLLQEFKRRNVLSEAVKPEEELDGES